MNRFVEVDNANVVVDTIKRSEDDKTFVIRVHEERGEQVQVEIRFADELAIKSAT